MGDADARRMSQRVRARKHVETKTWRSQKATEGNGYGTDRVRGNDADLGHDGSDARWWREVIERVKDF